MPTKTSSKIVSGKNGKPKLKVEKPTQKERLGNFLEKVHKTLTKPGVPLPEKDKEPLVETEQKNGTALGQRYHAYLFKPVEDLPEGYFRSAAETLAGRHPNIGDFWLKVGRKFIGVPQVNRFSLTYDNLTADFVLWVEPKEDNGKGGKAFPLGRVAVMAEHVQWVMPNGYPPAVPVTYVPTPPQPPPPTFTGKKADKPKPEIPVDKSGKEPTVFGHKLSAVVKWMAADAWEIKDIRRVVKKLGLKLSTVEVKKFTKAGEKDRKTGKVSKVTAEQGTSLNNLLLEESDAN